MPQLMLPSQRRNKRGRGRVPALASALEPRVLLDAAALATMLDAPLAPEHADEAEPDAAHLQEPPAAPGAASEIIFIDPSIDDWQTLLLDLPATAEVIVLSPDGNGLAEIAEHLSQRTNLSAIHIITHGAEATAFIGGTRLDLGNVDDHAATLGAIGAALSESGDILFYGCDIAAGEDGAALIARIAALTGADVAASDDLTGAAALGGDWVLESAIGEIEAALAVGWQAQAAFGSLLAFTQESGANNPLDAFPDTAFGSSFYVTADFDGDGDADIAAANSTRNAILYWRNNGDGTWTQLTGGDNPFNGIATGLLDFRRAGLLVLDMDGDGDIDIYNHETRAFWRNDGGSFSVLTGAANPLDEVKDAANVPLTSAIFKGDITGNGFEDVFGRNHDHTAILFWRNNGDGTWTQLTGVDNPFNGINLGGVSTNFIYGRVVVADINGDGRTDIYNYQTDAFWRNDGGTSFTILSGAANPLDDFNAPVTSTSTGAFTTGDFTGNGHEDLVGRHTDNNRLVFWRNNGDGTWTHLTGADNPFDGVSFAAIATNFMHDRVAVLDVDGDGDLDIYNVQLDQVFENGGTAPALTSSTPTFGAAGVSPSANIVLTFSEAVNLGTGAVGPTHGPGYGDIAIYNATTHALIERINVVANAARITGAGTTTITIDPVANLPAGADVYVLIGSKAFVSAGDGHVFLGIKQSDVFTFSVAANQAPTISIPASLNYTEGAGAQRLDPTDSSAVNDADSPNFNGGSLTAAITANLAAAEDVLAFDTSGAVSLSAGMTNGSVVSVSGTAIGTITSNGTGGANLVVSLNANAASGMLTTLTRALTYANTNDATPSIAARTITVTVEDDGGATAADTLTVNVSAVNDAPALTLPGNIAVTEDVASALTGISIADVDAGGGSVTATFTVPAGTLAATSGGGVTVGGSGTGALTLTGTVANINTFVGGSNVTYTTAGNANGNVTLSVTVNDGGNTGSGGALQDSGNVTLQITAQNDAPTITAPASINVTEDTSSPITGISFADVDAGGAAVLVTLGASSGTLAATSGGGVTIGGSGTGTLTLTGTIADINTFIAGSNVAFTTAANATGDVTLNVDINDQGNTGAGGPRSLADTVTLQVSGVNDAPSLTVPANIAVTEDIASALTGISIADIDAGAGNVTLTFTAPAGTLAATSGGGVTVGGSGTGTLTLTGTVANINTFIGGSNVTYTTAANANGNVTLSVTVNDGGNTGSGGALQDSGNVTLQITAQNDAPTITAPASINVTEDISSVLTGISFADVDAGGAAVLVTLSAPSGTLSATSGGGVTVGGSGTGTLTLTGTVAAINTFITFGGLRFLTAANATGDVTLNVDINDQGNTGAGGARSSADTVTLQVSPVNDAPSLTVPASIAVTEDVASAVTGISIADPDAGAGSVTMTLTAVAGTLGGTSGSGVTVTGSGTGTLTLAGTVANINAFIAGSNVTYTPPLNVAGNVTLGVEVNDNGNTGSGGALHDVAATTLQIAAQNDAPTITAPATIGVTEDTASAITGISFADLDAGGSAVVVTLSVSSGTLTATSGGGVTVGGSGTGTLTLSGSILAINGYLAFFPNVTFTTAANATANVTLTVEIDDQGNTGAGGAQDTAANVTLQVSAVNDAPALTLPANIAVTEDVASALTGISIADVDAGAGNVAATFTVPAGTLAATSGGGVAVGGSGTGALTLTGTVANINAFIAGSNLTYTTAANATGNVTLAVSVNDGGNTGAGGALTDNGNVTLQITAVNDAPTITAPATIGVTEDVASALTGISFADVDAGGAAVLVTLSAPSGTLAATSGGGVAVGGSGTGTLTLTGTIADINTFIAGSNVAFTTAADATADVTLAVSVDDQGNTGAGGAQNAATNVTLQVAAVNDAPSLTLPGNIAVTEDVASALTGIVIADVDAGGGSVTATFTVPAGTLAATSGGGVTVGGSGTGALTLTGTVANINAFIAGSNLTYTTAANATGNVTLAVSVNDGGNTGAGGALTDNGNVTLQITAVNDAPTITGLNGDNVPTVSGGSPTRIDLGANAEVTDVDSAHFNGGALTITQTGGTANGSFSLSGAGVASGGDAAIGSGQTISVGGVDIGVVDAAQNGQGGNNLVITLNANATPERVTALVRDLSYDGSGIGNRTFSMTISDGSDTSAAVAFTVEVTPNPPVITGLDGDVVTYQEGGAPVLLDLGANAIVSDADSANFNGGELRASITAGAAAAEDLLSISNAGDVTVIGASVRVNGVEVGTLAGGVGGVDLVVSLNADATPARVSDVLQAIAYSNSNNDDPAAGTKTIQVSIRDAAAGPGSATSAPATVTVNVTAVNDAPTITAPATIGVTEDVASALTGISFADVDAGGAAVLVTLSAPSGTLAATSGGGVAVGGSGTGTLTLTGTIADINTFIAGSNVAFTTAADATADVTLAVSVDDQGNTGAGGAQNAATNVTLQVAAVNDAPSLTLPGNIAVTEDVASALTGIVIADVDAGGGSVTATFTVPAGTLAATSGGGVTVGGSGTGALTLTGTVADINAFIAGSNLAYTTAANANGNVTLTVGVNDGGNTGAGGALTDNGNVTLQITAQNDAPTITAPGTIGVTEDVASALTGISFADVDAGGADVVVTLSAPSGTLAATAAGGVAVVGSGTGTLTLTGALAAINAFIAGSNVAFTTAANATADVTLAVSVNDQGNTGAGGAQNAATNVTLQVAAVNDAPRLASPLAGQSAQAGLPYSYMISAATFVDPDAGDVITYSVTRADGSALPAWLSFDAATRTFTGTPPADFAPVATDLALTVRATDLAGAFAETGLVVNVLPDDSAGDVIFRIGGSAAAPQQGESGQSAPQEGEESPIIGDGLPFLFDDSAAATNIAQVFRGRMDLGGNEEFDPEEEEEEEETPMLFLRNGEWVVIDPRSPEGFRPWTPPQEQSDEPSGEASEAGAPSLTRQVGDIVDGFDRRAAALDLALATLSR